MDTQLTQNIMMKRTQIATQIGELMVRIRRIKQKTGKNLDDPRENKQNQTCLHELLDRENDDNVMN